MYKSFKNNVKKLVGFDPGHICFSSGGRHSTNLAIEELNVRYEMLRLMNYSKWLDTYGIIN